MKKRLSLRSSLFLNFLAVLLLGMGVAAVLVWRSVESLYIDTQSENLQAQAKLIADALQGQPLPAGIQQPYSQTMNAIPGIHTRLIGEQGTVYSLPIAAGGVSAPTAENGALIPVQELMARPEIATAMQGQAATAIRNVTDRRILYAAAPVLANDGKVTGLVYLAMPLPAGGLPGGMLLQLAGAVLAAIALALLAGTLLARRIAAPVEAIARASAAVSTGSLTQRVSAESNIDELNSLSQTFNQMTASLRQSDQAKNAFVADVTHELRTPLTVIKGTIETLEDGALDDVTGRGPLLQSMARETDRLIRLVNDLLVLTRADAGALALDLHPLDLVELARARCTHLAALAARSEVQLAVTGLASACVLADADRASQVLDNLLDNAIRYSPVDTTIVVDIGASDRNISCTVQDCGPGIAAQHIPFIFDRFYRTDISRNRQTGGAGLGLAIARALVLAQGGQISAESQVGQGTTIRFSLPAYSDCPPTDHELTPS